MPRGIKQPYSRAFKLEAIRRLEAGESASVLAAELRVKRTLLYRWRDAYRAGGVAVTRTIILHVRLSAPVF
jgi:transposase